MNSDQGYLGLRDCPDVRIWSVRKALEEDSFEDVARTAILFGNDTDTTAAVACGLAGIRFSVGGIPKRWLEQLRGFEIVERLVVGLTSTASAASSVDTAVTGESKEDK